MQEERMNFPTLDAEPGQWIRGFASSTNLVALRVFVPSW
jgi:hypothetical protein